MFTERALSQLKLIIDNDFTLAGKYFRIVVSGKGCEGFTYAAGFTDLNDDDFQVRIANTDDEIFVLVDPFAAFYLQVASVDFVQDFELDAEGFVISRIYHCFLTDIKTRWKITNNVVEVRESVSGGYCF